ncbi:MAG: T9SS type A sorting domain-containing protein, partial [Bacteroidetes bacterium]|nr:T9SS type A sorting domain-containing protein [Bacteroidota bacterium]
DFEEILEIASIGDSNELQEYAVFDERPYQGLSYYRLKQTDFDGTFTYSDIVSVSMKNNDELLILSVFPNPTNGKILNLTTSGLNQEERVLMQIISVYGKPMLIGYFDADDRGEINIQIRDITNWSDGIYIITLYTEKGLVHGRIVKK